MKYLDIRRHLKPYSIKSNRTTTINHAFASLVAPFDTYNEIKVRDAILALNQNPDEDLTCVYCDAKAETWDHVYATVKASRFSGYGHRIGNLLPCCKLCNSRKGNKVWHVFLNQLNIPEDVRLNKLEIIGSYLEKNCVCDTVTETSIEYQRLQDLRLQILSIFSEADEIAESIRNKI